MTMKSLTTNDTVRSSLQRPRVSFNVEVSTQSEDMGSVKDADPLPIVELKPFVQKVWRREKSFASTWERSPSVATVKSEKSESNVTVAKSRDSETMSTVTLDAGIDDVSMSPPPKTSHSLPSRLTERFLTVYVNAFEDFDSQKEHFHKFVGESSLKAKRLHPVVDPKTKKQPEHALNIIPAFITRDDRTKTTLCEISDGDSTNRFYSFNPKAIGPEEIRKQQQLRVSGETIEQIKRPSPHNTSPTPSRVINGSWHGANVRHGSPASMLYHNKRGHQSKRTKTPLYDHLDRTGALPSLSINSTSLKRRSPKKMHDNHSEDYVDYSDTYESQMKHNVGGIENSLVVLSKHGLPTKVERQISFELETNLSRFRKLKDYSPFEINPFELSKYYPPPTLRMTQGEERIRQAMQSNAAKHKPKKFRGGRKGYVTSFSTSFNEMNKDNYTHGILKNSFNRIDHIDSYDSLYHPYNRASAEDFTPNEEPSVPYDTPRSRLDSRQSAKVLNGNVAEKKERVAEKKVIQPETKLVSEPETRSSATQAPPTEVETNAKEGKTVVIKDDIHVKTDESVIKGDIKDQKESVDIQSVQMKTAQPPAKQIDASGRTFITSDNIPQMGMVTG